MTDAYQDAGVSFTSGKAVIDRIAGAVKSTHDERVVSGLGGFGGVFDLASLAELDDPLLVTSTDGVGTKTKLSAAMDRWEGAGADIVNHGINDVLVQGAAPLFFFDTVAAQSLDVDVVGRIVDGMAEACRAAGCILLGGETAEMPGVFVEGAVDISGTMVGAVDRAKLLPRSGVAAGQLLVGMASSGLHTNGYSLARQIVGDIDLSTPVPGGGGEAIGDALCAVHRSYLPVLRDALKAETALALAHITGGGLVDNLPRVLPEEVAAVIDTSSWPTAAAVQLVDRGRFGRRRPGPPNLQLWGGDGRGGGPRPARRLCGCGARTHVGDRRNSPLRGRRARNPRVSAQSSGRIVVLASGSGTNCQALIGACASGELHATVTAVITNNSQAGVISRAETAGVPTIVVEHRGPREDRLVLLRHDQAQQPLGVVFLVGEAAGADDRLVEHDAQRVQVA